MRKLDWVRDYCTEKIVETVVRWQVSNPDNVLVRPVEIVRKRIRAGEKEASRITRCSVRRGGSKARPAQDQSPEAEDGCGGPVDYTVRKLAERFSVVNMKSTSKAAEEVFVENEVFNCSGEGEELIEANNTR